jgi:hypothetical protein
MIGMPLKGCGGQGYNRKVKDMIERSGIGYEGQALDRKVTNVK